MAERKRRNKVVPKRLQDNGLTKQQMRGVSTPIAAQCLILMSNHDETWLTADKLQTELGDPLSKDDLVVGGTVFYRYRGKPYKGEILQVKSGDQCGETVDEGSNGRAERVPKAATKRKWRVASEDEDSESELDTPQQPSKFKGGAEIVHKTGVAKQKRNVTSVDSESELDTSPGPVQVSRSKPCRGIVMSDDEYDKENRYLTTPKSTKGSSRKRVYSDEDEFNYPKRKERTLKRLVIPEDDYWSSTQSAPTTSANIGRSPSGKNVYDILESHTKTLNDLQKSVSKVLKYLKQLPSNNAKHPPQVGRGAGSAPVKEEIIVDPEETDKFITEDGVNLLSLPGEIPRQYALNVMQAIFTVEEMGTHCFRENSRTTKPGLDVKRVELIEDCVRQKFGKEVFNEKAADIRLGCNQKCLDKKRILANTNRQ